MRLHSTEKKSAVSGDVLKNFLRGAVIGHITTALAGNQQFLAKTLILFQKEHTAAPLCCVYGGIKSCRTTADDDSIVIHRSTCFS